MAGLSLHDLPGTPDSQEPSRSSRRTAEREDRDRRKRRRRSTALVVLAVCAVLFGGAAVLVGGQVRTLVASVTDSGDYEGSGSGSVEVKIPSGASGRTIGKVLADAGVVKTAGAFLSAADAASGATSIQPGTYELHSKMSAASAIQMLLDPSSRESLKVTVPEGFTAAQVYAALSTATGTPVEQYQAAAQDPAVGLPADAGGAIEGYLFPATYDFDPGTPPVEQLAAMVERSTQAMDAAGLSSDPTERHRQLTEASLVQAESGTVEDMGKVARVLENRIALGMDLQLDTTVNYANGKTGITTTAQDRANDSPYNTYLHPGLPPGPIDSPGEDALKAVLNPTPGDWLFFVVVNPDTKETAFAATAEEHNQNVRKFQAWLRANPQG